MHAQNALVIIGLFSFGYMANDAIGSFVRPVQAEVAGMSYQDLMRDRDFERAVEGVFIDRMRTSPAIQQAIQSQVLRAVMGYYELMRDRDFRTAVEGIFEDQIQTRPFNRVVEGMIADQIRTNRTIQQTIESQVMEIVEGQCHVSNGDVYC